MFSFSFQGAAGGETPLRSGWRRWSAVASLAAALLALAPGPASAQSYLRLDHRDQSSLSVTPGYEYLTLSGRSGQRSSTEHGAFADLGFGLPVGRDGGQGIFGLRAGAGTDRGARLVAPYLGYRSYAGDEEWKTFFDASAFGRILPVWGVGVRLGAGVQHELSQHLGLFFATGGSVAFGEGLQVGYDVGLGLQVRFGLPGGAGPGW